MTNSTSPWCTVAPSVNATRWMKPPTRGRTSTEFTASKWPVNSSQSETTRSMAGATVTWGACICGASFLHAAQSTKTAAAAQPPAWILRDADLARDKVELILRLRGGELLRLLVVAMRLDL